MRRVLKFLDRCWTAATRVAIILALGAIGVVAYRDIAGDTLSLESITVPRTLVEAGLGPDVVATDMRVRLLHIVNESTTTMRRTSVSTDNPTTAPDIVVPGTGYSIGSLTGWINARLLAPSLRGWLNLPFRKVISGEIVQSTNDYELRIRLNDREIYRTPTPFRQAEVGQEIDRAADEIAQQTLPYIYASYLFANPEGDADKQEKLARILSWIIATLPDTDENVVRAHNLRGLLLDEQGNEAEARSEFLLANSLAERAGIEGFEVAYLNLALLKLNAARATEDSHLKTEMLAQASQLVVQARARSPSSSAAFLLLGQIADAKLGIRWRPGGTMTRQFRSEGMTQRAIGGGPHC